MSKAYQTRLDLGDIRYIADTSALISLVGGRTPAARPRDLTRIVDDGRLRIPEPVAREIRRREDKLKAWLRRHQHKCVERARDESIKDLETICRTYNEYLGDKAGAADPIVVCFGKYFKRWTVMTDDAGIQAVCLIESIQFVTSSAFCRLERL